jgi:hypothetical protein
VEDSCLPTHARASIRAYIEYQAFTKCAPALGPSNQARIWKEMGGDKVKVRYNGQSGHLVYMVRGHRALRL